MSPDQGSNSKSITRGVSAITDRSPTQANVNKESPVSSATINTSTVLPVTPIISHLTPDLEHTPTAFRLVINQLRQACNLPPRMGPSPRLSPESLRKLKNEHIPPHPI